MIIVDTNVISEAMRIQPDQAVAVWFDLQPAQSLYLCTPVLAELLYGIERLGDGKKKDLLVAAVGRFENELYRGRILAFDQPAASHYARMVASREREGRRRAQMDALIAAIAITHGAAVATRDIDDFAGLGLNLINPFAPN